MKGLKIVEVEWEDSCALGGWRGRSQAMEHTVSLCKTTGYMHRECKKSM